MELWENFPDMIPVHSLRCSSCEIVNNYYKPPPGDICRVCLGGWRVDQLTVSSAWSVSSPVIASQ